MSSQTLYQRLGGYDAVWTFADNLLPRLQNDAQLARFWASRGSDRLEQEKQLLVDYLVFSTGGPMHYSGRDMKLSHEGMKISESDWETFMGHAAATMAALNIPATEQGEIADFVGSLKDDIVEG